MRFITILCFAATATATSVFQLNSTSYYSPDAVVAKVHVEKESITKSVPITYLSLAQATSADKLNSTISGYLAQDDVFTKSFLETLVLGGTGVLSVDVKQYLESIGCKIILTAAVPALMPGPYLLHPSGGVTKVYKLYWDHNFAFVESVTEGSNGTYVPVTGLASTDAYGALSIAVPSRLYYPLPTEDKPLSGKRLGVKDIYDLKGVRTSGGNRAYRDLTEPALASAPALQRLIDMGAVVIGKTKTTQFALGERPTADYVDQFAPSTQEVMDTSTRKALRLVLVLAWHLTTSWILRRVLILVALSDCPLWLMDYSECASPTHPFLWTASCPYQPSSILQVYSLAHLNFFKLCTRSGIPQDHTLRTRNALFYPRNFGRP
jgi:hypothetical protein